MSFDPYPTVFQTKHWRKLYESSILDPGYLKRVVEDGTLFVFIDAEPWGVDSSKPAEIGPSLLQDLDSIKSHAISSTTAWTLDAVQDQYCIETHRFRVLGRDRQEKNRQPQRFGQQHELPDDQVEKTISDVIRRFTQEHSTQQSDNPAYKVPLIWAGFSLHFEFCILSRFYPGLFNFFMSWLYLHEITMQVATEDEKRILPSLTESLVDCGFQEPALRSRRLHNAATDTAQAAALLIQLLRLADGDKLKVNCFAHKAHPRIHRKNSLQKKV
jgi:hypothetical protein